MNTSRLFPVRPSYSLKPFLLLVFNLALISLLLFELTSNWLLPSSPINNSISFLSQNEHGLTDLPTQLQSQSQRDATELLPNNSPLSAIPGLPAQACDPDPARVTSTADDGICNTLRSAIAAAASTPTKTVTFALPPDASLIISSTRGGITVPAGVTIDGGDCSSITPGYNIVGNGVTGPGLTLSGNNTLRKLTIGGFTGKQILIPTLARNNQLKCLNSQLSKLPVPPPDPKDISPTLDTTVVTDIADETAFLYTGPNAIQTGVAPGTITRTRVAVLRGKVLNRQNQPVAGVKITILSHPEYGQTFSRLDGRFDLVVNGGELLNVSYSKKDFLPLQRQVNLPWRDFVHVPDVVMTPLDNAVTAINLPALPSSNMGVVRGNSITDSDGTRRATLLIPSGISATYKLPGGATQPISNLHIRATEYTAGATGPSAMPGSLPPSSGYTYAAEWSVDEALAAGATQVNFSQPLIQYLENFLNFPVGMIVPAGYYDREKGQWLADNNGKVVKITSITSGLAQVDTDGNGTADNTGLSTAERQQLASLYTAGQSLWRTPITHFTPWDCNWPYGPPSDAVPPPDPQDNLPPASPTDPDQQGCIKCQNQVQAENIAINGTPFSLSYSSDRNQGYKEANALRLTLSKASVPASLKRIEAEITIAGQTITYTAPTTATNQIYTYTWDGKDGYGRTLQGKQPVTARVGYVYDAVYQTPAQFNNAFGALSGVPLAGNKARNEITLFNSVKTEIGNWDNPSSGLGGWNLDVNHQYDINSHTLYLGDGTRRDAKGINLFTINTIAGKGPDDPYYSYYSSHSGDGGPAILAGIQYPLAVQIGPDGSIYIAEGTGYIRKVGPEGIISTIAGNGSVGFSGDGGPATQAALYNPAGLVVAPDGTIYIADTRNNRVRRVGLDGIISTVAGPPAISSPYAIALGPDGSLYVADSSKVSKISTAGTVSTVAGTNSTGYNGDNIPANQATLYSPAGLAVGQDGSLYIADFYNARVRRVGNDGIITTVAGTGTYCSGLNCGDGIPATQAGIAYPDGVTLGPDGTLYVITVNAKVRRIGTDGIITTLVGENGIGFSGDGGPAPQAQIDNFGPIYGTAVAGLGTGPDGSLYLPDIDNDRIRKVTLPWPGYSINDFFVPSDDGSQVYIFNSAGRHLRTIDALTKATLYQFNYDSAGRLNTITDLDGLVTTIQHNANGNPTAIVGPYGQTTTLTTNASGYLATVANPAGDGYQMGYTTGGLLTSIIDPRNNASTISYDAVTGKLTNHQDAAGGFSNLNRVDGANSYTVTLTSAEGKATRYNIAKTASGAEQRTNLGPDNLPYQFGKATNGTRSGTAPNGASSFVTLGPDPRFNMQAPLSSSSIITAAPGQVANIFTARNVTLSNQNDLFSLSTQTDTLTINGRTTTQVYNASTKTFTTSSAQNRQSTRLINAQGRITSEQVAGLDPTTYNYDPQGRLTTLTGSSGASARSTTFSYYGSGPSNGYLQTITDPLLRQTSFSYDSAGRVTSQLLPGNRAVAYSYDAKGNLLSLTPPGQSAHTFTYNNVDLPLTYTAPSVTGGGTNQTSYSYNLDKQLTGITFPDSSVISLGYDSAGRVMTTTTPSRMVNYAYSLTTGQITSLNVASGGPALAYSYNGALLASESYSGPIAGSVSQTYNNNFWVASQSINGGNTVYFTYDSDGLVTGAGSLSLSRSPQNGLVTGSTLGAVSTTLNYNPFGELASYSATQSGIPLYSVTYTRDKLGRITQRVETIGGVSDTYVYSYDSAGRLSQVQKNGTITATYSYDDNGNRKTGPSGTATVDAQDRLLTYGSNSYTYNARGDLTSKTAGGQTTTYSYDVESNLLSAVVPLPGGTTANINYIVDGQNRRIGKQVNGTLVQGFLYQDGLRPVAELNNSGVIVNRFVYVDSSNVPAYLIHSDGVVYRLITDQVGSVRLVINASTGAVTQRIDYDEWGNVLNDTAPGFQPFGFAGGLYDRDTKLTRFGARDYDAEAGRWTTKDPIGFSGDTNMYGYAGGNPINNVDTNGLEYFVIGIEPPKSEAITNGVLNVAVDTGHTFAIIMDNNGKINNLVSVGPINSIDGLDKISFLNDTLDARSDWPIYNGEVLTYAWSMTDSQTKECNAAFNEKKKNPGNYTPSNQCTSSAISLGRQCGINLPNGVSPINAPWIGTKNIPNPYGLMQQLNKIQHPVVMSGPDFK